MMKKHIFPLALFSLTCSSYGSLVVTNTNNTSMTALLGTATYIPSMTDLTGLAGTTFTNDGPSQFGFTAAGPNSGNMRPFPGGGNSDVMFVRDINFNGPPATDVTMTFDFDLSVATMGFDITNIKMFAGFAANSLGHAHQNYTVSFSLVGSAAYTTLTSDDYTPFDASTNGSGYSQVDITDTTGLIVSGVDSIRFDYDISSDVGGNFPGLVLQELEISGTATVPEPSSALLLGLGGLASVLRRRRG